MLMSEQHDGGTVGAPMCKFSFSLRFLRSFHSQVITLFPETFTKVLVCVDDVDSSEFWHSKIECQENVRCEKKMEILLEIRGKSTLCNNVNVQCSVCGALISLFKISPVADWNRFL